ncbi:spore cortex biosynthesis protein YabQ [Bacillus testis]|uniref:spore cortex biosynthesis protein YabQ n=1 Tax=Bacillus testis TaxID=1622072 RepID=UPI00067F11E8|nr:spore cortex biosynthesis protein YabQ [Bacillus testis]
MTLTTQLYTLLSMIGMGACFGASLDTYQLFLKRPVRGRVVVFIHDILFWLVQAVAVFYILLFVNQGELRFYAFLALVCGFAAYQSLLKKGYMLVLHAVIICIKETYAFLKKLLHLLIVKPIVGIFLAIVAIVTFLGRLLFSFFRTILRIIWLIIRVFFAPIVWIMGLICKLLPKPFTTKAISLYNRGRGFLKRTKNYIQRTYRTWKNGDKDKKE